MNFMFKSSILINFVKKNHLAAGPLPGNHLKRWACLRRPAARGLNGAENLGKISEIHEFLKISKNLWNSWHIHMNIHIIDRSAVTRWFQPYPYLKKIHKMKLKVDAEVEAVVAKVKVQVGFKNEYDLTR